MNDLISREDLIKALQDKDLITWTHEYGNAIPVDWIMAIINDMPCEEKTPNKMTEDKLQNITNYIKDIMRYEPLEVDKDELFNIIASLHNELYKEVTGNYYDYMFHWSNKGWGGLVNDELFKGDSNNG